MNEKFNNNLPIKISVKTWFVKAMTSEDTCYKCGKKGSEIQLQYCFGCKKQYCLDCVGLVESEECYSNYVKYYVRCPKNQKHHMNSTWLAGTNRDEN